MCAIGVMVFGFGALPVHIKESLAAYEREPFEGHTRQDQYE